MGSSTWPAGHVAGVEREARSAARPTVGRIVRQEFLSISSCVNYAALWVLCQGSHVPGHQLTPTVVRDRLTSRSRSSGTPLPLDRGERRQVTRRQQGIPSRVDPTGPDRTDLPQNVVRLDPAIAELVTVALPVDEPHGSLTVR